jgi:hypothetical protein
LLRAIAPAKQCRLCPWTRNQLSDDELREWLASREEARRVIDIETCETGCWYVNEMDEYGIREQLGELPEELIGASINRWNFVRSAESNGWVSIADLPKEKVRAFRERGKREYCGRETGTTSPMEGVKTLEECTRRHKELLQQAKEWEASQKAARKKSLN